MAAIQSPAFSYSWAKVRFKDSKQIGNECTSSAPICGASEVCVFEDSQTIMSFGPQNSLLCRGGIQGSEASRAFLPPQGWQVAKQTPGLRYLSGLSVQRPSPGQSGSLSQFPPTAAGAGAATEEASSGKMVLRLGFLFHFFFSFLFL